MALVSSLFFTNILCALVPCEYKNQIPEINQRNNNIFAPGFRNKRLIENGEEVDLSYPIVHTKTGALKGYSLTVMSGRTVFAFEGIPYADVKVRFQEATPTAPWSGVRTAFKPGPPCLQIHAGQMFRVLGSEICLFLNVYTPSKLYKSANATKPLPVIVYIHGGSFAFGSGSEFGPSYLLERDVILVTLNYRLGVLGFLSTGDSSSSGNWGLKDSTIALQWVFENIAAFGGDSSRITLMGQSAGAVSVHLHMMSSGPSRRYFSQAVLLSGSAHTHWGLQSREQALKWTRALGKLVNCRQERSSELVDCLRSRDPNWLVGMQMNLFDWIPFPPVLFGPVIEPENSKNPFISQSVREIVEEQKDYKIPAIFSLTKEEGLMSNYALNGLMKTGHFINNVPKYLPYYLDYHYITGRNQTEEKQITEKILNFYLGPSSKTRNVGMTKYAEMGTDRMFAVSVNQAIKAHSRNNTPTYASLFSYRGKYNVGDNLGVPKNEQGCAHTEDIYYFFNASLYLQGFMQNDKEAELSKIMINLLANFADKGEPLYEDKSGKYLKIWDSVKVQTSDDEIKYLEFAKDIQMINDPFVERRKFWESVSLQDMRPLQQLDNNELIR